MTAPKFFIFREEVIIPDEKAGYGDWVVVEQVGEPDDDLYYTHGTYTTFQEALTEYLKGEREGIPSNN